MGGLLGVGEGGGGGKGYVGPPSQINGGPGPPLSPSLPTPMILYGASWRSVVELSHAFGLYFISSLQRLTHIVE